MGRDKASVQLLLILQVDSPCGSWERSLRTWHPGLLSGADSVHEPARLEWGLISLLTIPPAS